jgi:hypothetical protein
MSQLDKLTYFPILFWFFISFIFFYFFMFSFFIPLIFTGLSVREQFFEGIFWLIDIFNFVLSRFYVAGISILNVANIKMVMCLNFYGILTIDMLSRKKIN